VAPLSLPILLIINILLSVEKGQIYTLLLWAQILFYLAALAGWVLEHRKLKVKALFVPYYFCLMNWAMYAGLVRLVRGKQSVLWEKAKRAGE